MLSLNRFGFYDVVGEQIIYKGKNMYRYGELYKNDFKKIRSSPKLTIY